MSTEENKRLTRRVPEEVFNQGNLAVADVVFAPDYIEHAQPPPGWPSGLAGFKQFVTVLRSAFPDFHYTVDDVIAKGDKVAVRLAQGTHKGEFLGLPATGKQATWSEIHVCRHAAGKLVEHWLNQDQLGMLQQGSIQTSLL